VLLGLPLRHVVALALSGLLGGVKRREGAAVVAEDQALEQVWNRGAGGVAAHPGVGGQDRVDLISQGLVDEGCMLRGAPLLLVAQLPQVCAVVQQLVDHSLVDGPAIAFPVVLSAGDCHRNAASTA
jgi:hypothetical protein